MGAAVRTHVVPGAQPQGPPAAALRSLLSDLMRLLVTLSADVYRARVARTSGSIGGHVRHTLDHVAALVAARPGATLCYDHRARGTAVESDAAVAVREIMSLDAALERWSARELDEPVPVTSMLSSEGHSVTGWSTLGRELAFVVGHTIHHQAIIALLLEAHGLAGASERFGYAPSTPRAQ